MKWLIEIHYLPSIAYFAMLQKHNEVWIEQHEHYQKRSYRNRAHIAGVNGLLRLSVPLKKGKNEQKNIREVQIAYDENWQSDHWHSIKSAYGNAPYFEYYAPYFEPFYKQKIEYLFDFNHQLLQQILELIPLSPELHFTDIYEKKVGEQILDWRNQLKPQSEVFEKFSEIKPVSYPQVFTEKTGFLPNMSILDLLFCAGPQGLLILEEMTQQ